MLFLWIAMLFNALASQADFVNKYRIPVGFGLSWDG